jgi:hypothetical protein
MMPSALLVAAFWIAAEPVATEPAQKTPEQKAQNAARLKLMKETAARIEIREEIKEGAKFELRAEPVMRWDNHRSFVVDAATFVWLADHRPRVIGGMWIKNGHAWFDLQSLSSRPLTATVDGTASWSTSRPGVTWEIVASGPPPAASRVERLRQMKQLAEGFSTYAVKTAPDYDEGSLWHLRMLAQPIHRYAEAAAVDGAIFAFAQGTDPEAFLILESRQEKGVGQWHFAFAAACGWELHAKRGEREVWFRPKWNHQDADTVYGLVGPFAVDPKLFPAELVKPQQGK